MKRLYLFFILIAFSVFFSPIHGNVFAQPVSPSQLSTLPPDGNLSFNYANLPVTFTGFDSDTVLQTGFPYPHNQSLNPQFYSSGPYFWITNGGDPTKKPTLSIKMPNGISAYEGQTGNTVSQVDIKWGETAVLFQDNSAGSIYGVTVTYYSNPDNPPIPVAKENSLGGVLGGTAGDVVVDGTGKMTIPTALKTTGGTMTSGLLDIRKSTTTFPAWIRISQAVAQNGVTTFGPTAEYLRLGGGEWNVNSYRLIGFGYAPNATDNPPAYVGFQETNKSGNTQGNLLFATRGATSNTPPTTRLTILANGDIQAATGYNPVNALSLTTKGYVDSMPGIGPTNVLSSASCAPTTIVNFEFDILFGCTSMTIPKISDLKAKGVRDGTLFYLQSQKVALKTTVTFQDTVYTAGPIQPTTIYPGNTWMFKINGDTWRAILLSDSYASSIFPISANTTLSDIHDGDLWIATGTNSINITVPTAASLQPGWRFSVKSMLPNTKEASMGFAENVMVADPSNAAGRTATKTIIVQPATIRSFMWNGTEWYDISNSSP